jgi:hypothetical protein
MPTAIREACGVCRKDEAIVRFVRNGKTQFLCVQCWADEEEYQHARQHKNEPISVTALKK